MQIREVSVRTILTRTGGFLAAYTHSLNPYRGCSYGKTFCGAACYAPDVRFVAPGPRWGTVLEVKVNAPETYAVDYDRWRRGDKPLVVFMSSVTDPYVPQERRYRVTGRILRKMIERPPDALVLQTHTPNPLWDADTLVRLGVRTRVVVQISVETDRDRIPGFPRHAHSVEARMNALGALRRRGLTTVAVVAPLMPLADAGGFAARLGAVADGVLLDHYLIGDGSRGGSRTRRRKTGAEETVPDLLAAAGFEEWTRIEKFEEIIGIFRRILGHDRVTVSADGFNRAASVRPATLIDPREGGRMRRQLGRATGDRECSRTPTAGRN